MEFLQDASPDMKSVTWTRIDAVYECLGMAQPAQLRGELYPADKSSLWSRQHKEILRCLRSAILHYNTLSHLAEDFDALRGDISQVICGVVRTIIASRVEGVAAVVGG
jgi:hypothetical protein